MPHVVINPEKISSSEMLGWVPSNKVIVSPFCCTSFFAGGRRQSLNDSTWKMLMEIGRSACLLPNSIFVIMTHINIEGSEIE